MHYKKNVFSYLIKKIENSDFTKDPFKHIYIENFFKKSHFDEIIKSLEIKSVTESNDRNLINSIKNQGYQIINFPGCVTDVEKYINWHEKFFPVDHHSACEGFGMVFRLNAISSSIIHELNEFIKSEIFNITIANKLGINFKKCRIDCGIQKYLDGYEISPHADVRKKAATYMININPTNNSELINYHTHYLKFNEKYKYIQDFWKGNKDIDRSWVPWSWTRTIKSQKKNNSLVLFSPHDKSLHAIKARYNHLITQRTQLYGNLWFIDNPVKLNLDWEDMDLHSKFSNNSMQSSWRQKITSIFKKNC